MPARVQDVMTIEVVVAQPTTPVKQVARLLADHRLSALPVVVDGRSRVLGVVSEADLLGHELLVDPARMEVEVRDGVVSLTGRVERRSLIPIVVRLAGATEGVVRVQDWLTFDLDDTRLPPSASNRQRI
ncbi:MAG TPA: CBS domain-containing protein [Actinomycetota bacterium]|nr:CBS domain-containing protein [Actinomycetota bacterium]